MSALENEYDEFVDSCLGILCLLAEHKPVNSEIASKFISYDVVLRGIIKYMEEMEKKKLNTTVFTINAFQSFLAHIESQPNFLVMYFGFSRLLKNYVDARNSSLPSSIKELKCINEVVILFYRISYINPVRFDISLM